MPVWRRFPIRWHFQFHILNGTRDPRTQTFPSRKLPLRRKSIWMVTSSTRHCTLVDRVTRPLSGFGTQPSLLRRGAETIKSDLGGVRHHQGGSAWIPGKLVEHLWPARWSDGIKGGRFAYPLEAPSSRCSRWWRIRTNFPLFSQRALLVRHSPVATSYNCTKYPCTRHGMRGPTEGRSHV